jgi:hypothetical protein
VTIKCRGDPPKGGLAHPIKESSFSVGILTNRDNTVVVQWTTSEQTPNFKLLSCIPMPEEAKFKCLRCGYEFKMPFNPKAPLIERACPKCQSNSVRRIKEEEKI